MKKIIYPLLLSTLLLGACAQSDTTSSSSSSAAAATSGSAAAVTNVSTTLDDTTDYYGTYEDEDVDASYDESAATTITLNDDATEAADGVTVDGQTVTITQEGTYVVNGSLSDGQLIVNVDKEAKVHLIFNGVTISNESGAAVVVEQAEKVITTLASDTTNTLTDGSDYTLADGETEPDAAFYSKEDLSINGDGKLVITGNYSNGIRSKDDLVLAGGTYEITAKNNAIKGKDSVSILAGQYTLNTEEGDGIQANNTEDTAKGYVAIDGGTFTIQSGRDGIQAETNLSIQNADISIQTADGAQSQSISTDESYKGLKAGGAMIISSGTFTIDSADDSLHANDTITISGGTITANSGDDGIHADNELTINDGDISIEQSYEGLESSVINIAGGTIQVVSSDDGVNAGGGSDTDEGTGQFGQDSFGGGQPGGGDEADDSKLVNITGGTLVVDAEGDGIDSNGNVTMSGGTAIVNGPTTGGNGALDYNGTFTLTGGVLLAAGTTDMAMNVSDGTQQSVAVTFDQSQSADTLVTLLDGDGNAIVSYAPSKSYQHVVISTPDLTDSSYTLVSGGSNDGESTFGYYAGGTVSDGTELGTLPVSDTIANLTQSGETASTNQMGGGGFGR
ncbi:carbohydrate-binding domain-containing protein [Enterococcus sp.]|uniref:carbohydrate-binding domain-containing protein n=1 Tax=Enterococcus sp. TaxID=35783 RepID=UPI00289A3E5D|nr:carbohydrate-binding domain-containing protein [Enterococcus sp.]